MNKHLGAQAERAGLQPEAIHETNTEERRILHRPLHTQPRILSTKQNPEQQNSIQSTNLPGKPGALTRNNAAHLLAGGERRRREEEGSGRLESHSEKTQEITFYSSGIIG